MNGTIRCPDGGIDEQGYYGHLVSLAEARLCADDEIRCVAHAEAFNASEGRTVSHRMVARSAAIAQRREETR